MRTTQLPRKQMPRTLVQIKREMEKLQKEADRVLADEVVGVVQRIKVAIDSYGLTENDLFGTNTRNSAKGSTPAAASKKAAKPKKTKRASVAKYQDKASG